MRTGSEVGVLQVHYHQTHAEQVQLLAVPILGAQGRIDYVGEYICAITPMSSVDGGGLLIGRSRAMLHLVSPLQRVAPTETTVLLLGESGVGKVRVAAYIHHYFRRGDGPFVVLDCATLADHLIENELFGLEKGAFTGADARKKGLFETADGGTLFIDEIGDLPLPRQSKLLRVLETGTVRRVGGTDYLKVRVRVIAATNRDLAAMVEQGLFRRNLCYRLTPFPVSVPALRERKDDVPALAEHFLARTSEGGAPIAALARCHRGAAQSRGPRQCARAAQRDRACRRSRGKRNDSALAHRILGSGRLGCRSAAAVGHRHGGRSAPLPR